MPAGIRTPQYVRDAVANDLRIGLPHRVIKAKHGVGNRLIQELTKEHGLARHKPSSELPGMTSGHLTVAKVIPAENGMRRQVECRCGCGETTIIEANSFLTGGTRSCGCLQREAMARTGRLNAIHGLKNHSLYQRWNGMMQRCNNPDDPHYPRWGGRGIQVEPYLRDVTNYVEYIGTLPMPPELGGGRRSTRALRELLHADYTIDRIDNDGDYERGNLRWASDKTQNNNRRNSAGES